MIDKMIEEIFYNVSLNDLQREKVKQILQKYKAQEQKWISVEESLPEKEGCYLVLLDFGNYKPRTIAQYKDGEFYNKSYYPSKHTKVIAWAAIQIAERGGVDDCQSCDMQKH